MKQTMILVMAGILGLLLLFQGTGHAIPPQSMQKPAAEITAKTWLNTTPLSLEKLQGKVVMVEFWTYGCYNCVNVEPYVKQWYETYHDQGFEIIAVHSPEFSHERVLDNVRAYVKRKQIKYPVAIDNDFAIWKRYNNRYWPAMYLIDKQGQVRYLQIGEGRYRQTENMIKRLLAEE